MQTIPIRNSLVLLLAGVTLFGATTPVTLSQNTIDGFNSDRVAAQRRWEEQFRAVPDPQSAREHLRRLTLQPHIAGTKDASVNERVKMKRGISAGTFLSQNGPI